MFKNIQNFMKGNNKKIGLESEKPTCLDLFCGAGGFSLGFLWAGYDVILGVDHWFPAIETHSRNIGTTLMGDLIKKRTKKRIYEQISNVDVIIGGPPCQGFSIEGLRNPNDSRNDLFKEFVEIVNFLKPKLFVFENVPGIISMKKSEKRVLPVILKSFRNIDYNVRYKILNSQNYGVAQRRKRFILIGSINHVINFPVPNKSNHKSVRKELERFETISEGEVPNHQFTTHSEEFKRKINLTRCGDSVGKYRSAYWRLIPNKPSPTVKENHGSVFIHYKYDRVCTPRELAALQSFPDDFKFYGNKSEVLKQIGNAVPPLMAKSIAESIKQNN